MFHPQGPSFFELARQALSSTQRGYDLLAPKFDYTPFRTPDFVLNRARKKIESLGHFESAIDLGCGTGAAMQMLLDAGCDHVAGMDFSRGMLDQAEQNLRAAGDQSIDLINGDILTTDLENEFDLAVCFGALGHVPQKDEPEFVGNIARLLKPGGKFLFVTSTMLPWWSPAYWLARGFNGAMHVRNVLVRPAFIMFYLTFLWPDVKKLFEKNGMRATAEPAFPGVRQLRHALLVLAEKPRQAEIT
jgi:SAM-dependent methyltransferase